MKPFLLSLALALLIPLSAARCADPEPATREPGTTLQTVAVGGLERYYLIHPPHGTKPDHKIPVVIFLQGGGTYPAQNYEKWTGFDAVADREGFAIVYACSSAGSTKTGWSAHMNATKEDFAFFDDLIRDLVANHFADPERIYLSGLSAGALMSHRAAVEMGGRFAAIGIVAGTFCWKKGLTPDPIGTVPPAAAPVPMLIIHGKLDDKVPYGGADNERVLCWPVLKAVDYWVKANGCDPAPIVKTSDDGNTVATTYAPGKNGAVVVLDTRVKGTHDWPAAPDFQASQVLWDFFKKYSRKEGAIKEQVPAAK